MDDDALSRLSYPAAMYSPAPTRSIPPTPHLPNEHFEDDSYSPSSPPPPRRAIPPPPPGYESFESPTMSEFGTNPDSPAALPSTFPFSRPITPASPRTALRPSTIQFPKRWFPNQSLHTSPSNSPNVRPTPPPLPGRETRPVRRQTTESRESNRGARLLSGIEVVPPTPPALSQPVDIPQDDVPTPSTPNDPDNEASGHIKGEQPSRTPVSRVARLAGTGRNMANRLSKTFHDGTPPPAIVRLPYPDVVGRRPHDDPTARKRSGQTGQTAISRRPVSNVYMRGAGIGDPRRLSAASNHAGGGSRRQSVVSAHFEPHPVHHSQQEYDDEERMEEGDEVEEMRYHHASTSTRATARSSTRPGVEHQETATSDETYVTATSNSHSNNTWDTSSNSNSNSSSMTTQTGKRRRGDVEGMMRVDPLTVLERRRRRDYTIGSHHPLHGPPNTPAVRSLSVTADTSTQPRTPGGTASVNDVEEEEEIESIKFVDVVDRFRSVMRRFGDMPWVAKPCVATLIIPQNNANDGESTLNSHSNQPNGGPVIYGFGPGGNGGAVGGVGGTINGIQPRGAKNHRKSSSTSAAAGDAESEKRRKELPAGWYRPRPSLDEILGEGAFARQNRQGEGNAAEGDGESSTGGDTVVPPPIPARTKGIWYPQKPEASAQTPGRERFTDALVIRGLRRFST